MQGRFRALREVMRPWKSRFAIGAPLFVAFYQFGCDQFGWPTLPSLWFMTGSHFPWWGWLLLAQAGFIYALFEYVRRNVGGAEAPQTGADAGLTGQQAINADILRRRLEKVEEGDPRIGELATQFGQLDSDFRKMGSALRASKARVDDTLDRLLSAHLATALAPRVEKFKELTEQFLAPGRSDRFLMEYDSEKKRVWETLAQLGLDGRRYEEELNAARERIMGDAAYYVVKEGEPFADGEAKRHWHLQDLAARKLLDAFSTTVKNLESRGTVSPNSLQEAYRLRQAERQANGEE